METIVGGGKQQKQYRAESMEDLAQFFDRLAQNKELLMNSSDTKKAKRENQMQAYAYHDAANIIRNTQMEGAK